ncbi:hypothetical protein ACFX2J_004069 [Malus domestica]
MDPTTHFSPETRKGVDLAVKEKGIGDLDEAHELGDKVSEDADENHDHRERDEDPVTDGCRAPDLPPLDLHGQPLDLRGQSEQSKQNNSLGAFFLSPKPAANTEERLPLSNF